jgi:hypothetical protein
MVRCVLASSGRYLVHSKYATQLARLEARPPDVAKIGVILIRRRFSDGVRRNGEGPTPLGGDEASAGSQSLDCDLRDSPEEILQLLATAREGYDIVLTKRDRTREPWFRRLAGRFVLRDPQQLPEDQG